MKTKSIQYFFAACFSFFLLSCEEVEEPYHVFPPVDGGAWEIFAVAKVYVPDIPVDDKSFTGSIENEAINLGRIPGDTLVFIIPNVGEGPAQLKVTIGKQIRTWDLVLEYWPYYVGQKTFFEEFLKINRDLQVIIGEVDRLKELAEPFGEWIEFFRQNMDGLTDPDKDYLSGALQNGLNGRFFGSPYGPTELECINGPASTLGAITYRFIAFDNTYLLHYQSLPKNGFHQAVLSGLALSFWYQKVLHEYFAHQTLECPQLRSIELIEIESGNIHTPEEPLEMESNERATFGYNGIFKPLSTSDLEEENGPFFLHALGFKEKELAAKLFADLAQAYKNAYEWSLPSLNPSPLIIPPKEAPGSKGPIQGFEWFAPRIDNPNIRLVEFFRDQETMTLRLESKDGQPQPLNMVIPLNTNSFYTEVVFPAILKVSCPILSDLLLIDRTHSLDIKFGAPPYDIVWSNGARGELSQTLPPGDYEVKVTDADACERTVQFTVPEFGMVQDIDGNVYETIKIDNLWWMTENLRTTKKNEGSSILSLPLNEEWQNTQQAAYSWFENNPQSDETDGKLYNYYAACCDICPNGWRLPSLNEYREVANKFGIQPARHFRAVNKWSPNETESTNLSGLKMLSSGVRAGNDGSFGNDYQVTAFWTDERDPEGFPFIFFITDVSDDIGISLAFNLGDGLSIRCVRDE